MKVSEVIQEFIPCEICGNNDLNNFYFYVLMNKSSRAYVKCCECEEEYYSTKAKKMLARGKESRNARITLRNRNQEYMHPLIKVLAQI
jgi:hypothetical protein